MEARSLIVLLGAVVAVAATARLGVWQLDRAAQKTETQAALDRQRARPPLEAVDLPRDAAAAAAEQHRAVRVRGRWLAEHTVYLDNRPLEGRAGFHVLTPLLLMPVDPAVGAEGRTVLVQRGWWPRDPQDRTRIAAEPPPAGEQAVEGRLAIGPSRLYDIGASAAESGAIRQNLDLAEYARSTGLKLAPFVVVQEDGAAAVRDGLVRRWPAPAAGVHKHYGYAFQWFALSALVIALYVWFQLVRPRRRR